MEMQTPVETASENIADGLALIKCLAVS